MKQPRGYASGPDSPPPPKPPAGPGPGGTLDHERLIHDMDLAKNHQGDYRAMRVTLECGHLRLMAHINCVMGIGASTACRLCPLEGNGSAASRLVVNVEETGVLSNEYSMRVREGLPVSRSRGPMS